LRLPRGLHRHPGADAPRPLAVGGRRRRRRHRARGGLASRRDLAHRAGRAGRLDPRRLARAARRRAASPAGPLRPRLVLRFAAMGVAPYLPRAPLLLVLARRRLPTWLEHYFAALPIALIPALALPLVLLADGRLATPGDPRVPAAVLVAILARWTGNLLLSVAAGVALVPLARAFLS